MNQTLTLRAKAKIKYSLILFFSCLLTLSAQYAPTDDFDGDGIINSIDIDDDNDGVLDVVENTGNGSCDTSGGVDISTLNFVPTSGNNTVVNTTSSTINVTGNSWHSDYSTTTVTAPFYFEFTADASTGNMMIGVIGATQAQPTGTNSNTANSYKFHFQDGFNYQVYRYAVTAVTGKLYGAGDKFSIEVNASNNIVMKRNGVVVYTDAIVTGDTQFKLHISVTSGRTFSNVVWGGTNSITTTCEDADSDGDGILNRFELDSDNDGCPDAYEAGVSSNPAFTQFPAGNVGTNGFENSIETSTDSGIYNGVYTYQHAMNGNNSACIDSDGDGIRDVDDKDDDNDGVPDSLETISDCGDGTGRIIEWDWEDEKTQSSSYAYFANKPEFRPLAGPGIDLLGAGGAWRVMNIDNNGTLANAVTLGEYIYGQFTVREKGIYVNGWSYYQINNTSSATQPKMGILIDEDPNFGSPEIVSDGVAAIQPYGSITYPDGFPRTLAHVSNPTYLYPNTTYYVRFYDLKTNGFNDVSHDEIGLVFEEVPGGVDCGGDIYTDGDAVPNRLDLDSDGDGCSDLVESGVSPVTDVITPSGTNNVGGSYGIDDPTGAQLNPAATDVNNDGINDSIDSDLNGYPNYSSSYQLYAISADVNACPDTDGDGIADLFDIDDDNDGIVDAVESPDCFYTSAEAGIIAAVSTPLPNDDGVDVNLPFMHDGVTTTVTASNNVITLNQAVNGAVIYNIEYPTPVKLTSISHYGTTFGTSATSKIQGSNDKIIWDELMTAATAATASPKTFTVNNNAANYYRYYRIVKVAGTTTPAITTYEVSAVQNTTGYIPSAHPKSACSEDTDEDGIYNHLDLDSDDDGCPDLVEAGVSPSTDVTDAGTENAEGGSWGIEDPAGAQLNPAATDANNDGLNDSIDTGQDGQADYQSTYHLYAIGGNINLCSDVDGDGIFDITDIDDDNDGIVDAVESPDCFYTSAEAGVMVSVSTPLPNDDGVNVNLPFMHDGVTTTVTASNNVITLNQAVNGAVIYNIEYPTPVRITSISHYGTTFGTNATAKIQGSNDKIIWDELMTAATAATASPKTFTVNNNAANYYRYYRIVKVAGTTTPAVTTYEVSAVQNTTGYIPSAHPKPTCDNDPDGDGINNHQDLDSDNDGCPDLVEASVSPDDDVTDAGAENNEGGSWGIDDPAGAQLNPAGTDANNDGLNDSVDTGQDGQTDYTSTYYFAEIPESNACLDTDGDGVRDVFDLDDDNDGVLDKTEQICSNNDYNTNSSSGIDNIFSRYGLTTETLYDQLADDIGLIFSLSPAFSSGISLNNAICSQPNLYGGNYNATVWIKSVNPEEITVPVPLHSISLKNDCQGNNEILSYTAYDINGLALYTYDIVANQPHTTNQKIDLVMDPDYDVYRISIERSADALVVVGVTLKDGNGFFMCDASTDTDGDGIPNHLDLDSDNDGCPDLAEAGVSPGTDVTDAAATNNEGGEWGADNLTGAQLDINGTDVNNDGLNDSVDLDANGVPDYTSTYTQYAMANNLNTCADTDNDSINDLTDIDDDNDGILDAEESPDCFYTQAEAGVISTITSQFSSPDDDQTDGDIQLLHDGSTTATFNFSGVAAASNPTGSNIFTIEFPTAVKLASLTVSDNLSTTTNSNAVIVGSNDGVTWSSALSPSTIITTTPITFTITATQEYKYYKIRTGSVASNLLTGDTIGEITVVLATGYIPSAHPKPDCSNDTDNDGVMNHHDLDSDGDGCPDMRETGVYQYAIDNGVVPEPGDGEVINGNGTDDTENTTETVAKSQFGFVSPLYDTNENGFVDDLETDTEGEYDGTYDMSIYLDPDQGNCVCYKPGVVGTALTSISGISTLAPNNKKTGEWENMPANAFLVLESKEKGFVITRMADPENTITGTDAVEGMLVYDTDDNCLKMYDGTSWFCLQQRCPD